MILHRFLQRLLQAEETMVKGGRVLKTAIKHVELARPLPYIVACRASSSLGAVSEPRQF